MPPTPPASPLPGAAVPARRASRALATALLLAGLAGAAGAQTNPPPAIGEPTLAYTVAPHDTLIGLNRDLFAVPKAWPEVARLNRLKDPNRIQPGQVLQVPTRLLRSEAVAATLVSAEGDVRIGERAAKAGDALGVADVLRTGADSSAVLQLADGSRLRLAPGTEARLDEHRRYRLHATRAAATDDGLIAATLRLLQGGIEVFATKVLRAKPLEVSTPTAVIGVRGTQYRVRHAGQESATEVLDGAVRAELPAVAATATATPLGADVAAGFGAVLQPGQVPAPVALAPAPDLSAIPARFERPLVRVSLPAGSPSLRVQVAADAAFDHLVRDERVAAGAEIRIADLPDGHWHLRAREIAGNGLEGRDAAREFELKARPEPPAAIAPTPQAKRAVGPVLLRWAENLEAAGYRIEVARDAEFTELAWQGSVQGPAEATFTPPAQAEGPWFWRLGSIRADGDRGPWGDPQTFTLRPLPEPPTGGMTADGHTLALAWGGRAEDRFRVELARDSGFAEVVQRAELAAPQWQLPRPEQYGSYYFRYRSVEPDDFVTPWSSTLKVEVARDWGNLGWLLLPLALTLF